MKREIEVRPDVAKALVCLAQEGFTLSVVKQVGKGTYLVEEAERRYVLKLPVPPKNGVQRLAARVFGGNLKFRREVDFYRNLGKEEAFASLPLIWTDGRSYMLIAYLENGRVLWERPEGAAEKFVEALVEFQGAEVPSGRSWLERWALQFYFGVNTQVLRFAIKTVRWSGFLTFPKVAGVLVGSWWRQGRNPASIQLHNDILYNILEGPDSVGYLIDFEEVTRENRWFLIDVIEAAFDKEECTVHWPLVFEYVEALRATGRITVPLDLYAQMRVALLFRVTHAIVSKSTREEDRAGLVIFYRRVLLSKEGYRAWFAEHAGEEGESGGGAKVVITVPDLTMPGGVANYFSALQPHLTLRARYVTRGRRANGRNGLPRMLRDYRTFWGEIRGAPCRLVQINTSLAGAGVPRDAVFVLLAKLMGKRVIVFFRGWDETYARKLERSWLWLFRLVYFRADCLIVLGRDFEKRLRAWGWQGEVRLETTAVEDALVAGVTEEEIEGRAKADSAPLRILYMGRMERAKGIYELLESIAILRSRGVRCAATFAGIGSELEVLRARVRREEMEEVIVPGQIEGAEKRRVLAEADLFVLPTRHGEGMPNSVLEAMAMGLPVVTTRVGGVKDFFVDGEMGILLEDPRVGILAECLERLARDPNRRRRIGLGNHQYAMEHFLASKVALRLEGVWDAVLAEASARRKELVPDRL